MPQYQLIVRPLSGNTDDCWLDYGPVIDSRLEAIQFGFFYLAGNPTHAFKVLDRDDDGGGVVVFEAKGWHPSATPSESPALTIEDFRRFINPVSD